MQAQLSPARIESILTTVTREREGQSLTAKLFQKLLGLMAAASNMVTFGLLHMRPLQWWLRTTRFSPRSNLFHKIKVTRRCFRALDMWKKPWFLSQGPMFWAPCCCVMLMTDASLTGWGGGHEWPLRPGSVGRSPSHVAHQLPGDAGSISSIERLSPRPERPTYASTHRQYIGGLLHQPPRGSSLAPPVQAGTADPLVDPREIALLEGSFHPWVHQSGSKHPVETGPEARVMDVPHRGGGADLEEMWDLFASRETSQCPLWFSLTHPAPLGLDAMVQTWQRLRLYAFPPIALLPGVLERVSRDDVQLL